MSLLQIWSEVLRESFGNLWFGVSNYVPNLIVAIVIFVIGWLAGSFAGRIIEHFMKSLKVDDVLKSAGIESAVHKTGLKLNSGALVGGLVRWFIILAFLVASFEVLGLDKVTEFLKYIVLVKIPQVIVAVLILMVAVVIAEFVQKLVVASARATQIRSANFVGSMAKWTIWIFAIIVALSQVGIADEFLLTFFQGVVVAASLALGLAYGLGGQEAAARSIEKMRQEIAHHE